MFGWYTKVPHFVRPQESMAKCGANFNCLTLGMYGKKRMTNGEKNLKNKTKHKKKKKIGKNGEETVETSTRLEFFLCETSVWS